ncbi:MAG: hypothetical protein JSW38_03920 [Dehalococcoidia bacterium]|nr:MAG: hypothetical protein JSW38_03920 [Dehalococcoidia bacterium]
MYKWLSFILVIGILAWLLAGCGGGDDRVLVGFSLAIGQRAAITGEDLEIEFLRIVEDSRCPRNATCIWEGRARCLVEIAVAGSSEQKELEEPGLTDEYSVVTHEDYRLAFHLEPYPGVDQPIPRDEYRLQLIISK